MNDHTSSMTDHTSSVFSVAFSPPKLTRDYLLASGSRDNTIKLWNPVNGNLIRTIESSTNGRRWLAFSPDSNFLASALEDDTVKLTATGL